MKYPSFRWRVIVSPFRLPDLRPLERKAYTVNSAKLGMTAIARALRFWQREAHAKVSRRLIVQVQARKLGRAEG